MISSKEKDSSAQMVSRDDYDLLMEVVLNYNEN